MGRGWHHLIVDLLELFYFDDNGKKDAVAVTSLSTCIIQCLANASSVNLVAEDRARRRIEIVSSSEREKAWRSWVAYEVRESAWNPAKKGEGGRTIY